jgi:hypothetical protein
VGLALNPDSSEDKELKIKGILDIEVGDYSQDDLLGQKEDAEEALALAEAANRQMEEGEQQHKAYIDNAIAENNKDDEDRDSLTVAIDLLRPQRIKRQPARDCYFTAEEAEAGDTLVVQDPVGETTDSEDQLADGWDDDDEDDFDPDVEMEDVEMV